MPDHLLQHSYDVRLVALSVCLAMVAAYAALDLAGRVTFARGKARSLWLTGGAVAMGIGIWSMHYVGMLAFRLPVPARYDWPTVLLSLIAAILACAVALFVVSRPAMGLSRAVAGSLCMGGGIAVMHYTGMAAMRLSATWTYSPGLVALSVVLAIVISLVALWLAFHLRGEITAWTWRKAISAVVMGAAIPIMHYTGMAAAHFLPAPTIHGSMAHAVEVSSLSVVGITMVTLLVLGLVVVTALADRRFSLQALELEASRRHHRIIETALDAFIVMDSSGVITDWNTQAEYTFGWSRAEAVGRQLSEIVIPHRLRDAHTRGLHRFLTTGEGPVLNKRIDLVALHRNGHEFPIEVAICPFEWGDKHHFAGFVRDVTERNRAQQQLAQKMEELARSNTELEQFADEIRAREQQLSSIYNTVADAIFRLVPGEGGTFRFHSVNQAFLSMTGYTWEDVIGRPIDEVIPKSSLPLVLEKHQEVISTGSVVRWEQSSEYPAGVLTGEVSVAPVFDAAGTCTALVGAIHNVTERKQVEEQLRQVQKMEAIGRLAGGIAHDFNNILTTIAGYSDMILDQIGADKPISGDLKEIRSAADRATSLTRQLLAFSRRQVLDMAAVDLNEIIRNVERMLQRLIGEDIEIQLLLAQESCSIVADRTQLEQVLVNVAANARDAMPLGGHFTIETALADGDEVVAVTGAQASAGRYVRLKLSDTGHGMDAHTRERVFEPFFTTKEFGRGTGLGLATVYGIVQQLGGYVGVSSEVGRGTTFALYYPESRVEAGPIAVGAGRVAAPVATNRKVILVVEDEPSVRILVSRTLKRHGYLVLEASNAAEGLMISERHEGHIDVVLSDVVMPRMDGPEMIRRLREARREVRVLFMSGYTGDAFRHQRGLGTEAHVLEKPFTAHALLEAIQARLDDGSSSSGSAEKRPAQPRLAM